MQNYLNKSHKVGASRMISWNRIVSIQDGKLVFPREWHLPECHEIQQHPKGLKPRACKPYSKK
jgi:hypothetical protein